MKKKELLSLFLNRALAAKKKNLLLFALLTLSITIGVCSCKAWRTVSTTATYVQSNDSTKSTATISTKTTEEYVGIRKK